MPTFNVCSNVYSIFQVNTTILNLYNPDLVYVFSEILFNNLGLLKFCMHAFLLKSFLKKL